VWLQITATLLVAVFNFPGLLIYFILRPQHTLAQSYIESLEEDGWRRSVTESGICPACQQGIEPDFLFCPSCQARLRRVCARCEHPILLRWKLCPYCGSATGSNLGEPTPFPEREPLARPSQNPQDRPD
jgi:RNA polymerase subunit RPABC4/transcription elongation factor Spt4